VTLLVELVLVIVAVNGRAHPTLCHVTSITSNPPAVHSKEADPKALTFMVFGCLEIFGGDTIIEIGFVQACNILTDIYIYKFTLLPVIVSLVY